MLAGLSWARSEGGGGPGVGPRTGPSAHPHGCFFGWGGAYAQVSVKRGFGGLEPTPGASLSSPPAVPGDDRVRGGAGSPPRLDRRPHYSSGSSGHVRHGHSPEVCLSGWAPQGATADVPTDTGQLVRPFQIALALGGFTSFRGAWLCNSLPGTPGTSSKLSDP